MIFVVTPEMNAVVPCTLEVVEDFFNGKIMFTGWVGGILAEFDEWKRNIGAACHHGIDQLANGFAIIDAHFLLEEVSFLVSHGWRCRFKVS